MKKIEKRWIAAFGIMTLIAALGLFWPEAIETSAIKANFGTTDQIVAADVAWLLTASCLVLLMTPGLSFFYGGMVGKKNVISTMLQSFIALGVISLVWVVVGFSLSFGDSLGFYIGKEHYGIIGNPFSFTFFNQ